MADLNFDVAISLRKIYLGVTGEKEDYLTNHSTMVETGIESQNINIVK